MKTAITLTLLTAAIAAADHAHYVNFVRQIQKDSGVAWDFSVTSDGSMLSPEGVGPSGSLFQLWSIHSLSGVEYHLDEEFVSAYTPSAAIEIVTGDPYPLMPRTRVDQPFRVNIDIDGLLKGTDVPAAAGQVLLNHAGGNYPENTHSFKGSTEYYVDLASATIDKNGALALDYAFTNLSGADLTKVEGEEIWSIHALNGGENGETLVEGEILESATLQVWPIAEATITGIEAGESYGEVPAITVTLSDLYPDSTTFLRISEAATNGNSGDHTDVQSSYVIIKDSIPQQRTLTLDGLDDYFPNAGTYSLEVLHTTPFGTEVLARVHPITIDRVISIRGSINSSD